MNFCPECRKDIYNNFTLKERYTKKIIRGRKIERVEEYAVCNFCGEEIWIAELQDKNLEELYNKYREGQCE